MSKDVLITPASGIVEFKNTGTTRAQIELDNSNNLLITSTGGDVTIGTPGSNLFVGDGVNSVDIVFEQNGAIRALTGKTLALGQSDSTVRIDSPLLVANTTSLGTNLANYLTVTGATAGNNVSVTTAGSDTNINLNITTKGAGAIIIDTGIGAGQIDLKPGSSNVRIWDDDSSHYHQIATGNISANYTLTLPAGNVTLTAGTSVVTTRSISTSTPLAGGGDLSANRTLSLASGYGDTQNPYASKTANTFLAAPNGSAGVPAFRAIVAADVPTLNQNTTGTASGVVRTVTGTTSAELVRGNMGDNDQARILVGATAINAGFLEIATADDGTEPIYVRQYTGTFTTLARTATLLDGSGNTSFPGTVTANGVVLTGNTGTVTSVSGTAPIVSSGGTGPTISISAATTSAAGSMSADDKTKLDGIAAGAQVNVATNLGYTTAASNGTVTSSTGTSATIPAATTSLAGLMTSADKTKLDGIAADANNYSLPNATTSVTGGVRLGSDTQQTVAANAVTTTASRTYAVQVNSSQQMLVNVPWVDTNTTYSAGNGISLSGTTFTVSAGTGLTQEASGLALTAITAGDATVGALRYNSTTRVAGQLYGGTTNPSSTTRLNYDGHLHVNDLNAVGNVNSVSDERLKTNWRPVQEEFLDKVLEVKSGVYDRIDDGITQAGVSAQDWQKVLPETVNEDNEGMLSVNYGNAALVTVIELTKLVKQLQKEIEELKSNKN